MCNPHDDCIALHRIASCSFSSQGVSSFHNQGDPQTSATGFAGLLTDEMGFPGGMPLIMLSPSDQRTLVLSPITSFLSTTYTVNKVNRKGRGGDGDGDGDGGGDLLCGVQGAVATIPANHTAETIAFFGGYSRGVTETVMAWGDVLLGSYGTGPYTRRVHTDLLRACCCGLIHMAVITSAIFSQHRCLLSLPPSTRFLSRCVILVRTTLHHRTVHSTIVLYTPPS